VSTEGRFVRPGESWLLDGLDDGEKKLASRILETCAAQHWPAGSVWRIDDLAPAEALVVEDGFLVVRASSSSARRVVVAESGAGSILLAPGNREHVQALTDCWVTVLSIPQLEGLLAIAGVAATLVQGIAAALRLRQDATSYFASVHHVERVRQKLLQLAREFGRVNPDGIRVEFPLTHDLLAEMVASARETITRAMDELQRSGFVIRDGHFYTLLISPEALDAPG
jgi:CRP-like cAMP-binding protein